jgi:hypothetical protein
MILCVCRLNFSDANEGGDTLDEVTYELKCPDRQLYKDLHSEMHIPPLNNKLLDAYLQQMGKAIGDTEVNMYKDRYLSFLRVCELNRNTYIYAECHAEMKKSVSYKVDIVLESDGVVSECQCECAVGMGPTAHCKHVCACLFGFV